MPEVIMYATSTCPYCERARRLLDRKGVSYTEINVDQDPKRRAEMEARSGRFSVPQIFIGEHHVGGYDDTVALDVDGNLDSLLGLA
jgi:glutaredoxin 3